MVAHELDLQNFSCEHMCHLKSVALFGEVLLLFVMVNRSSWKRAVFKVFSNLYNFLVDSFSKP